IFFFSSRRRHTIFSRDWSSDVCSSDLPFVDGNKRTGTVAALVFLDWNGFMFEARPGVLSDLTLAVTSSAIGKREIAEFFEVHCRSEERRVGKVGGTMVSTVR